jgi:ribosomal protein L16/L10AE
MSLTNKIKLLGQTYKKYQKGYSIGSEMLAKNDMYSKKVAALILCKRSIRLSYTQLQSFLKLACHIKGKHIKKIFKKKLEKSIYMVLQFNGIFTSKSKGMRMGKGKGSLLETGLAIKSGNILFKISYRINHYFFKKRLKKAMKRLSTNHFELFFL